MKRKDAMVSAAMLMYRSTKFGIALSAMIVIGVALFAFVFASDVSNIAHAGETLRDLVWRHLSSRLCPCPESAGATRWLSRGIGCVFAGLAAAVFYAVICYFIFFEMRALNMIEYCRIRCRLLCWSLCMALSVFFSRFFINIFVPFTFDALIVTLAFLTTGLVIRFLRTNRPVFLIADYFLLGVLSALSVSGIVMLLVSTLIMFLARIYHDNVAKSGMNS